MKIVSTKTFYPGLDHLRGFGVTIVVIYHCFSYVGFLRFGWMGVDLFFVLSGFLITDVLLKIRNEKNALYRFYMRRALRIFPIYFLLLWVFFLFSPFLFSNKGLGSVYEYYSQNKGWFFIFLQNWLRVYEGPAPVPYLDHLWTLAIEEQFYLLWPLVVLLTADLRRLKTVIICCIVIALLVRVGGWVLFPTVKHEFYYNTLTRMDSLLLGAGLNVHLLQGKTITTKLICAVTFFFLLLIICHLLLYQDLNPLSSLFQTIGYSIIGTFSACILFVFLTNTYILSQLYTFRTLGFLGKISYGIYVYHLPIYLIVVTKLPLIFQPYNLSDWFPNIDVWSSMVSIAFTILISYMSFLFIEKPFLNLKKYFA